MLASLWLVPNRPSVSPLPFCVHAVCRNVTSRRALLLSAALATSLDHRHDARYDCRQAVQEGRRAMPTRCLASPFYSCRPSTFAGTAALTAAKRLARTASGRAARRRASSATSGGRSEGVETGAAGPESAESAPHSAPPSPGGFRKSLSAQGFTSGGSTPLGAPQTIRRRPADSGRRFLSTTARGKAERCQKNRNRKSSFSARATPAEVPARRDRRLGSAPEGRPAGALFRGHQSSRPGSAGRSRHGRGGRRHLRPAVQAR